MRCFGLLIALAGCQGLLGLEHVSYRDSVGTGGASAGGAGGGGGGAAPLDGAPQWLYVVDDSSNATAGLGQWAVDGVFDDQGNAAVALLFDGKPDQPPAPTNAGAPDVLLMTIDPTGEHLRQRSYGDADPLGVQIATLGGNIFATGFYRGQNVNVGMALPKPCTLMTGQTVCPPDIYSVKFDGDLDWRWSRRDGDGTHAERTTAIDTLPDGIVVGGSFDGNESLFGKTLSLAGGRDAFAARLRDHDVQGASPVWAVSWGGSGNDELLALDVRQDTVAVIEHEAADPNPNLVLRALDPSSGGEKWSTPPVFSGAITGRDVAVAPDGSIVVAASLEGAAIAPDGSPLAPGGAVDLLLARVSSQGVAAKPVQLPVTGSVATARLAIDDAGHIVLGATVQGTITIDGQMIGGGGATGFVAKLDSDLSLLWSRIYAPPGAAMGASLVTAVDALPAGDVLAVGGFTGTIDFELAQATAKAPGTGGGQNDGLAAFAMRLGP